MQNKMRIAASFLFAALSAVLSGCATPLSIAQSPDIGQMPATNKVCIVFRRERYPVSVPLQLQAKLDSTVLDVMREKGYEPLNVETSQSRHAGSIHNDQAFYQPNPARKQSVPSERTRVVKLAKQHGCSSVLILKYIPIKTRSPIDVGRGYIDAGSRNSLMAYGMAWIDVDDRLLQFVTWNMYDHYWETKQRGFPTKNLDADEVPDALFSSIKPVGEAIRYQDAAPGRIIPTRTLSESEWVTDIAKTILVDIPLWRERPGI